MTEVRPPVQQAPFRRNKIHPQKFALYAGIASLVMMFAAFTSAYIVRQGAGNWQEFRIPSIFFISTAVILASSVTLHVSYKSFLNGRPALYKGGLIATLILGLAFIVTQYQGWLALTDMGVMLDGNPSGSFVYLISGAHAAHVLGGIAALIVALLHAFFLPYRPTKKRKLRFELVLIYWHFVDFLWVYLITFFVLQS